MNNFLKGVNMQNVKTVNSLYAVIICVTVGVVAFFGGVSYQKSRVQPGVAQFGFRGNADRANKLPGNNNAMPGNVNNMGFRPLVGEVLNVDDKSITVKLADGSSKLVLFSNEVPVTKSTQGSRSDLTVGVKVGVLGSTNTDGSVSASSVTIDPEFGNMRTQ